MPGGHARRRGQMRRWVMTALAGAVLTVCVANGARAQVYRWHDDDGNVQFSDRPPAGVDVRPVPVRPPPPVGSGSPATPARVGRVVMYSASWCGVCDRARRYFRAHAIAFEEYDVETTVKGRLDYRRLGAAGVPVILVGERRLDGFSERGFRRLYE
ncbi:MAG TPA: glutaredoxin family protein [Gammaproteobacteria bacterium]|nr:glutaredoxin family protein [Gammaproteobacteria bacterium]MCH78635.1 glutaredoxin family protein [Gammaproteobacteria bacterium]